MVLKDGEGGEETTPASQETLPVVESTKESQEDVLIKAISEDLGFSNGNPIAASLIFKCLVQWRSFEVESTTIFDRVNETIGEAFKSNDNNEVLCYWISNCVALLMLLLPRKPKASSETQTPQQQRIGLFCQQLHAYIEKIYQMIQDKFTSEISPVLEQCIAVAESKHKKEQHKRSSLRSRVLKLFKWNRSEQKQASETSSATESTQPNTAAQPDPSIEHWHSICKTLNNYLNVMKANHVPPVLIRKMFTQIFYFINVQLFNSLLLHEECCTLSNGEYLKSGLTELEKWCNEATEEYAGSCFGELKHTKQAVEFLLIDQKPEKTLNEIRNDLCPALSIDQLFKISTLFKDDKHGTHSLSSTVLSEMKHLTENDENSTCFSLEVHLGETSFTEDEISKSVKQVEVVDIDPPPLLRENPEFAFLLQHTD